MKIIVKAKTNTKNNNILALNKHTLKIHVSAPPIKGKANKAIIKLLAQKMNIAKSLIEIKKGHTAPSKVLEIHTNQATWNKFYKKLPKQKTLC